MNRSRLIPSFLFFIFLVSTSDHTNAQQLSGEESALYKLVMKYRQTKGLPAIPLSRSLAVVAQTHAKDLAENYEPTEQCSLHSWSDKGKWEPVCYTGNQASAELMWSKPAELTSYKSNGYEIAFAAEGYPATASEALVNWKQSKHHNDVLLNRGFWKRKWKAIGIGIYGSYAVIWFGNEPDAH